MGGSGSTRRITIDNDNPTSVIKVTEECAQRVWGHKAPAQSAHPQGDGPVGTHLNEPSLTSIQLRQDNIKALNENDEYWAKRIKALQCSHEAINKVMEEEYQKALDEVSGNKSTDDQLRHLTAIPCGNNRAKIIACYKMFKNEPMKCAKEVQEFADCVDQSALMIASK